MAGHEPPPLVARAAQRWGLVLVERTSARYSEAWFALRGQEHVVLKVGDPAARAREAACLRGYEVGAAALAAGADPLVACRVLAHEPATGVLLLERVLAGDDLRTMAAADDDAAMAVAGGVIAGLHTASDGIPRPPGIPPLADILATFDAGARAPALAAGVPAGIFDAAHALARELTSDPGGALLHGDCHHSNILRQGWGGPEQRWRAIDPHGWWGDPAFDTAALMLNPFDFDVYRTEPLATARRRAAVLAAATGLDAARILAWTAVGAVISELWCLQDHGFIQGAPLRAAVALLGPDGLRDPGRAQGC